MRVRPLPDGYSLPDFRKQVTMQHLFILCQALERNFSFSRDQEKLSRQLFTLGQHPHCFALLKQYFEGDIGLDAHEILKKYVSTYKQKSRQSEPNLEVYHPGTLQELIALLKRERYSRQDFAQLCSFANLDIVHALVQDEMHGTHNIEIVKKSRELSRRENPLSYKVARLTSTDSGELELTVLHTVPRESLIVCCEQTFPHSTNPPSLVFDYIRPIDIPNGGSRIRQLCLSEEYDTVAEQVFHFLSQRKGVTERILAHLTTTRGLVDVPFDWIGRYMILGGTLYEYEKEKWCVLVYFNYSTIYDLYLIPLYDLPAAYTGLHSNIPVIKPPQQRS